MVITNIDPIPYTHNFANALCPWAMATPSKYRQTYCWQTTEKCSISQSHLPPKPNKNSKQSKRHAQTVILVKNNDNNKKHHSFATPATLRDSPPPALLAPFAT